MNKQKKAEYAEYQKKYHEHYSKPMKVKKCNGCGIEVLSKFIYCQECKEKNKKEKNKPKKEKIAYWKGGTKELFDKDTKAWEAYEQGK